MCSSTNASDFRNVPQLDHKGCQVLAEPRHIPSPGAVLLAIGLGLGSLGRRWYPARGLGRLVPERVAAHLAGAASLRCLTIGKSGRQQPRLGSRLDFQIFRLSLHIRAWPTAILGGLRILGMFRYGRSGSQLLTIRARRRLPRSRLTLRMASTFLGLIDGFRQTDAVRRFLVLRRVLRRLVGLLGSI